MIAFPAPLDFQVAVSEQEPHSELNPARLENVAEAALNTKVAGIIKIGTRCGEATAIEQVEELGA